MTKVRMITYPDASLVEDYKSILNQCVLEIVSPEDLMAYGSDPDMPHIIGITRETQLRDKISNWLDKHDCNRLTFIHPTSTVEQGAYIGPGSFVAPYCHIGSGVVIGNDVMIGPYCMISHRAQIGRSSILHPGVMVAGNARVGARCKLNIRSTILDYRTLEDDVELAACSTATKDLSVGNWAGSPARKINNG